MQINLLTFYRVKRMMNSFETGFKETFTAY